MQKSRCTVLSGWIGDASEFMIPVNVFPSVETLIHCCGWVWQSRVAYRRFPMLQVIRPPNPGALRTAAIAFSILTATAVFALPTETVDPIAEIQSVIRAQQEAWNRGDIDGFMNGYARSASTVFISEDTIRRGWETVRDRYRQKYSNRKEMGTLTFSEIETTLLSPDSAVVLGRWSLDRAKDRPHGRFTLIFKRLPEGWRIVQDHTSAAPPSE